MDKEQFRQEMTRRREAGLKLFFSKEHPLFGKTIAKIRKLKEDGEVWVFNAEYGSTPAHWLAPSEESMKKVGAVRHENEYGYYWNLREKRKVEPRQDRPEIDDDIPF